MLKDASTGDTGDKGENTGLSRGSTQSGTRTICNMVPSRPVLSVDSPVFEDKKICPAFPRQTFELRLEALADDTRPPAVRLKQILKLALRGFRLKCTTIKEIKPMGANENVSEVQEIF